jgi:hypothetical protein
MKMHWIGLIAGALFYIFALIPGVLPHRVDVVFMILSGLLIASFSFIGFDVPFPRKKLAVSLLMIGGMILLGGILIAIIGHPYILFIITVPALGLVIFGLRQLLDEKKRDDAR